MTRQWIEVNELSGGHYSVNKNIRFKTLKLGSDLHDSSDAHIVVKGKITVKEYKTANRRNKKLTFKNKALYRLRLSKVSNTFADNAEDPDIVMPMYNLLDQ